LANPYDASDELGMREEETSKKCPNVADSNYDIPEVQAWWNIE
jgi:hypothetical protein